MPLAATEEPSVPACDISVRPRRNVSPGFATVPEVATKGVRTLFRLPRGGASTMWASCASDTRNPACTHLAVRPLSRFTARPRSGVPTSRFPWPIYSAPNMRLPPCLRGSGRECKSQPSSKDSTSVAETASPLQGKGG